MAGIRYVGRGAWLSLAASGALCVACSGSVSVNADVNSGNDYEPEVGDNSWAGSPPPAAEPHPGPPVVTYPGFSMKEDGTSIIIVEVTKPVEVENNQGPNVLLYRIKGAKASEKVNRMPLNAQFFPTRVSQISVRQAGPDVDVVVELRQGSEGTHRVYESEGGMILEVVVPPYVGREVTSQATVEQTGSSVVYDGRDK